MKIRFDILGVKKKVLSVELILNTMEGATRTLVSKVEGSTRIVTKRSKQLTRRGYARVHSYMEV